MIDLNENLLSAWLQLSTSVVNSRVVSRLAYNESLICHVLYHHQISGNEHPLTATDLCNQTRIVKSLMNRILNQLEAQGLVSRTRSSEDKRQVFVTFNLDKADVYMEQHREILSIIDAIIEKIGPQKAQEVIALFTEISSIANDILNEKHPI